MTLINLPLFSFLLGGVDREGRQVDNLSVSDLPPQAQAIFARLGIKPQELSANQQKRVSQLIDNKPSRSIKPRPPPQPDSVRALRPPSGPPPKPPSGPPPSQSSASGNYLSRR